MDVSLTVLKCFLFVLEFVEFLMTPLGLSAIIILLIWNTLSI